MSKKMVKVKKSREVQQEERNVKNKELCNEEYRGEGKGGRERRQRRRREENEEEEEDKKGKIQRIRMNERRDKYFETRRNKRRKKGRGGEGLRKTRRKSEEVKSNLLKLYKSPWGPQFQSRKIPYPSLYGDPRAFRLPVYTGCPRINVCTVFSNPACTKIKKEKKKVIE
jgi:hypothetical protein